MSEMRPVVRALPRCRMAKLVLTGLAFVLAGCSLGSRSIWVAIYMR